MSTRRLRYIGPDTIVLWDNRKVGSIPVEKIDEKGVVTTTFNEDRDVPCTPKQADELLARDPESWEDLDPKTEPSAPTPAEE